MQPPQTKPTSALPVEEVLASYSPALPGERKAPISRSNSASVGPSHSQSQSLGSNIAQENENRASLIERPRSREGFAGIGSGGRTPSPQPNPPPPNPMNNPSRMSYAGPLPNMGGPARMTSPSENLGISLDESCRVAHDAIEQYAKQAPPFQPQLPVQQPSHMRQPYGGPQRSQSINMAPLVGPPPAVGEPSYGGPPPGPYPGQPQQPTALRTDPSTRTWPSAPTIRLV